MKLDVKIRNFGKVHEANITIRPFTVITGCNSSGKSFITRGLYSILHTLNQDIVFSYIVNKLELLDTLANTLWETIPRLSQADQQILEEFFKTLSNLQKQMVQQFDFLALLKSSNLLLAFEPQVKKLDEQLTQLGKQLKAGKGTKYQAAANSFTNLENELKQFHSNLFKWTEVYTQSLESEIRRAFCENFQITNTTNLISGEHSQFALNEETFVQILPSGEINFSIHPSLLNETQSLKNVVYLESPVYFKMRNALKDFKITQFNLVRRGAISPIPKYFYDLDNLLSANLPDVSHKFAQIATKIEQIIHGNLAITPRGDIVYQEQNKNPVSLNMASSGISNLGMIALLLRHNILDEGSFLFIDEPEINLHTTWQHLMLDILLDLSHAGVNVVVATHSLDMLHRLEHIVSPMTDEEASMQISINRLTLNGETEPYAGSVLSEIYAAKQVLGEPYIKLLHERLP